LATAERLEHLPATAEAFRSGELSGSQASEIAASASVDPDAESQLLATARDRASFRAVRDGHLVVHAEMAPDVGARVVSVLDRKTDELFRAARAAGTTELRAADTADALAALVLGESTAPAPDVRLHLDAAALERGDAEPGERCHLDGVGPVPVTLVKTMLQDAEVTVLHHDPDGDITAVSAPTRTIPTRLRRWVEEAYPSCGRVGCDATFRLEIVHVVPIARRRRPRPGRAATPR
jgi:hypothetical protein